MNVQTKRLLLNVYRSSKMGMHTISTILNESPGNELKDEIMKLYEEYSKMANVAEQHLTDCGVTPEDNGILSKAALYGTFSVNRLNSPTLSKISEMMIGESVSSMSLVKTYLKDCVGANDEAKELAQHYIEAEETNIEKLKNYL